MVNRWVKESRAHLEAVDEDYFEHMRFGSRVGGILIVAGLCCLVHSLVPALFPTSASRRIRLLAQVLQDRSALHPATSSAGPRRTLALLILLATSLSLTLLLGGADIRIAGAISVLTFAYPAAFLIAERGAARRGTTSPA